MRKRIFSRRKWSSSKWWRP